MSIASHFNKSNQQNLTRESLEKTNLLKSSIQQKDLHNISKLCSYPLSETLKECLQKNYEFDQIPENLTLSNITNVEKFNNSINQITQQSIWYQITFRLGNEKNTNQLLVTLERKMNQNSKENTWRIAHYEDTNWELN